MEKVYETIECIRKAFPEGMSDEIYHTLIAYLHTDFSKQNFAALLSYVNGKDVVLVQQDIEQHSNDEWNPGVVDALQNAGYQK